MDDKTIESLINNSVQRHIETRKELLETKSMLETFFDKDSELQEVEKQIKQLQKKRLSIRYRILKEQEPARLKEKVNELKKQDKDIKVALSDYLSQYSEKFNTTQIELNDGMVRTIQKTAKLVNLK